MDVTGDKRDNQLIDPQGNPTGGIHQTLTDYKLEEIRITLSEMKTDQAKNYAKIELTLEKHYVTQSDFMPIQKLVYGLVGLILTSFVVSLLVLVFKR